MKLARFTEGMELPVLNRAITQEKINLYAEASGDFNPIHIDQDFARRTPLGGTIAHGMLILAYVSQMMTEAFGQDWLSGGKLDVRFRKPARPGDVITVRGKICRIERSQGQGLIECDVLCCNQRGETVINGEAKVRVSNDENSC